jgi:catechol 2,3-dioxygenase-like lactoylglutathione lyase family enzyme
MTAGIRLGRIVLMVRGSEGLAKAVHFYNGALGLSVSRMTDDWAELRCGTGQTPHDVDSISITLQAVHSESQLSTGYSPLLSFQVDDMDTVVARCAQMGGHLDGPIQYPAHGKVAALRSPDGHMIGLYQANLPTDGVNRK